MLINMSGDESEGNLSESFSACISCLDQNPFPDSFIVYLIYKTIKVNQMPFHKWDKLWNNALLINMIKLLQILAITKMSIDNPSSRCKQIMPLLKNFYQQNEKEAEKAMTANEDKNNKRIARKEHSLRSFGMCWSYENIWQRESITVLDLLECAVLLSFSFLPFFSDRYLLIASS